MIVAETKTEGKEYLQLMESFEEKCEDRYYIPGVWGEEKLIHYAIYDSGSSSQSYAYRDIFEKLIGVEKSVDIMIKGVGNEKIFVRLSKNLEATIGKFKKRIDLFKIDLPGERILIGKADGFRFGICVVGIP